MWKVSHINKSFIQKLHFIRMYPKTPDHDFQYPKIPDWWFFLQIYPIPDPNPKFLPIPEPDPSRSWKYLPARPCTRGVGADFWISPQAGKKEMLWLSITAKTDCSLHRLQVFLIDIDSLIFQIIRFITKWRIWLVGVREQEELMLLSSNQLFCLKNGSRECHLVFPRRQQCDQGKWGASNSV